MVARTLYRKIEDTLAIVVYGAVWVMCLAALVVVVFTQASCAGRVAGVSVASQAAASALTAYEQARISGMEPDDALRSAGNAAIASAVASGSGLVDADYRPFVEAALRVLAAELARAKVSGPQYPSSASVAEAIQHAITKAETK